MLQYQNLLKDILENGEKKEDRTGTGTLSVFGRQNRYSLRDSFPLLTTKKIHFKSVAYELLWFLSGSTNVSYLQENGVRIWNEWADENGELGPVYGSQWRSWKGAGEKTHDQIKNLLVSLKENPHSRRHLVNAWNVGELENMALPPCHALFQFYVSSSGELSCQLYQRSADVFLGVPFNVGSYALLTCMIAQVLKLVPGEFVHTLGDAHLYLNHLDQAKEQLKREPKELPKLILNQEAQDLFSFQYEDFQILNYSPHPRIAAPISV